MIWTVPNLLTMLRILAAPGVAVCFLVWERPGADWVALGLFAVAALTDFLDGWLARALGQESEIGRMLDPIADKAMVIIALMVLLWTYRSPEVIVLPAVVIALREVLVSGLREYLGDVKLRVTYLAKWKTTVQLVAIGCLLSVEPLFWLEAAQVPDDHWIGMNDHLGLLGIVLLWIAAGLTLLSGADYFRKGLVHIRAREDR